MTLSDPNLTRVSRSRDT